MRTQTAPLAEDVNVYGEDRSSIFPKDTQSDGLARGRIHDPRIIMRSTRQPLGHPAPDLQPFLSLFEKLCLQIILGIPKTNTS